MSVDLSSKNVARLKATAQAEGVSVDDCVERLLNEREAFTAIVERASAHLPRLSPDETRIRIEQGFLQSERGEVMDGEAFSAGLLDELDEMASTARRMYRYVLTAEAKQDLRQIRDQVLLEGGFSVAR